MLGMAIFSEKLPSLWWVGASLLIVGNVIAGRKNDGEDASENSGTHTALPADNIDATNGNDEEAEEDEDLIDLGNEDEL